MTKTCVLEVIDVEQTNQNECGILAVTVGDILDTPVLLVLCSFVTIRFTLGKSPLVAFLPHLI